METKIKAVSLKKRLVTLFFSMLSISTFTFGGGFVIVTLMILSLVSYFYALFADNPYVAAVLAGMQAGVAAVIVDVVLNLGMGVVKTRRWLLDVIMVAAFAAAISGVNVIYIILTSGVIGVICAIAGRGKKAHAA